MKNIAKSALKKITNYLDKRVIWDRDGEQPYLNRWYVVGRRKKGTWKEMLPCNLFIHQFKMSDDAGALHSHPFAWSLSFVISGGYLEEKRVGDEVIQRMVKPFTFNFIRNSDYHRVDLVEEDAWTIFLAGKHVSEWFFWDRDTKKRCFWKNYTDARESGQVPELIDDLWEDDSEEDIKVA